MKRNLMRTHLRVRTGLTLAALVMLYSAHGLGLPQYSKSTLINDLQAIAFAKDPVLAGSQIMMNNDG